MNKFIKPATLTVPQEIYDFLSEIYDFCDEHGMEFYDMIEAIVDRETSKCGIEITYED